MGHVLRVWHDLATNWYFDIDRRNPAKVAFAFEHGLGFDACKSQAKVEADQMLHVQFNLNGGRPCDDPLKLNWKLVESTGRTVG